MHPYIHHRDRNHQSKMAATMRNNCCFHDNSIFSYVLRTLEVITSTFFTLRVSSSMLIIVSRWNCCLLTGGRERICAVLVLITLIGTSTDGASKKQHKEKKRDFEEWIPVLQPLLKQSFNHLLAHMYRYTNLHVAPTLPHKHTHTHTKDQSWR